MAQATLRAGLALVTVVAATDCLFALAAGAGAEAAVEGTVLTGLGLAAVVRTDVAARVLRPKGRIVVLAALFAVGGVLEVGLQRDFAEVAAAITCIAALISAAPWALLCCAVSAAGFLGALAVHGSSLAWMVGEGRYVVAGQLVNLAANVALGLLMIALLRRFLAEAALHLAAVRAGGRSLTPQLALAASGRHVALLPAADARTLIAPLTDGEREVVTLLASGRVPKQAARELSIALATVRSRIAAAKRKTGARTLDQLVALYVEADLGA
jgi:DNA-binding CsgD family transcriptional regulator